MNIQSAVDQIAARTGLNPAAAEHAAGTILSVIQQEVDPATSAKLFQALPGAAELAAANQVTAGGGGMLGSLASTILGTRAGVLAAGFNQLESSGLTVSQIETAASSLLQWIRTTAGGDLARRVANGIPGIVSG